MIYLGRPCSLQTITDSSGRVFRPAYQDKLIAIDTGNNLILRETMISAEMLHHKDICILSYEVKNEELIKIYRNNEPFIYMVIRNIIDE